MSESLASRVMGGAPLAVLVRLAVVSLIVGALMSWLHVDPADLLAGIEREFVRVWGTGFEAVANVGRTALAGAAIVLPAWVAIRLLSYRGRDRHAGGLGRSPRWSDADRVRDESRS